MTTASPIRTVFRTAFILFCVFPFNTSGSEFSDESPSTAAFTYLKSRMDRYHRIVEPNGDSRAVFDISTEKDAAGNHFASTGAMGDWQDIFMNAGSTNQPFAGNDCLEIRYNAIGNQGNGWAGVYWQYPPTNWGNMFGSHNLEGVSEIRVKARGAKGGEKIELKVGGINRPPYHTADFPFEDSCDLLTTGLQTLTPEWGDYSIDLLTPEFFWIYRDKNARENHYVPSGWMGANWDLSMDENWQDRPYSGNSCIKISYSARTAPHWAGIYWQALPDNWGALNGAYNLTGATKLTFRARADLVPGQGATGPMSFFVGGIYNANLPFHDAFRSDILSVQLTDEWREFSIDLQGRDLSAVIGGFCWETTQKDNPDGCTIYLDDIRFDKTLNKDMSAVIGGFCWAADKLNNPQGCTFYLDDVRYIYKTNSYSKRMSERGLIPSYEVNPGEQDDALRNVSFVYDMSLAMLAFMARGLDDDWMRARIIADSFCLAQKSDRYFNNDDPSNPRYDGRLRNAYRAGDLIDPATKKAMLPGWWSEKESRWLEDKDFDSTSSGNVAWAMIALLGYHKHDPAEKYLSAAIDLGRWLLRNTSSSPFGGYTGGYEGFDGAQDQVQWKSTEHNLDIFVAFSLLSAAVRNEQDRVTWLSAALHAKEFVSTMWNPQGGHFWTGTKFDDEGKEIANPDVIPVDVQAWSLMTLDNWRNYRSGIDWAEKNLRAVRDGYEGFGFSLNTKDLASNLNGIWFEGTAQMLVALQILGRFDEARHFLDQIESALEVPREDYGRSVNAASRDHHSTGFSWEYHKRPHIGATSWFLLASEQFNPYWQTGTIARPLRIERLGRDRVKMLWAGDVTTTFILESSNDPGLPGAWHEVTRVEGKRQELVWTGTPTPNSYWRLRIEVP
jgi:hypothetical protein